MSAEELPDEATQEDLVRQIQSYWDDPYGFVMFVYPWGEEGTRLASEDGPDEWQTEALCAIRDAIQKGGKGARQRVQMAIRSGHGVGKTALVAWLIMWFMATRPDPQVVVTANTKQQLTTKTWRELAKWHYMSLLEPFFDHVATQYKCKAAAKTWFATAIPWSENNSEAFAGTHEDHVAYFFDEASAIADIIWEVSEGAMTDDGAMWFAFGNPTKITGRFAECWTRFRASWLTYQVDSRKAKRADKEKIAEWARDYGEDSDFFRVRVRGLPPRTGPTQFIGEELVQGAIDRVIKPEHIHPETPLIMGWDISRGGSAMSVGVCRRGRLLIPESVLKFRGLKNLTALTGHIAQHIVRWQPDLVVIDATGIGAGVCDALEARFPQVVGYYAADRKIVIDPRVHYNHRIEVWDRMKRWLESGSIPDDIDLRTDLCAPEFFPRVDGTIILEPKEAMEKRGAASPDYADALSMTFSQIMPTKMETSDDELEPEYE